MNSKGIAIGLVLLAILGAGTYVAYKPRAADAPDAIHDPWQRVDRTRVDHVTIQRPPENGTAVAAIELEKTGGSWRMAAPGRGPTEARAVEELVDRFADMHVTSIAGRSTDSYDEFEVDDPHAVHVTLKNGGTTVIDVWVGAGLDGGTALRVPGHTEIYRVDQSVRSMVTKAPRDWRDREISRIERDQIRAIEWVNSHGTFSFTRNGDTWSAATGTTIERLDTARVSNLVDSVANLRATDFADAATGVNDQSPRVTVTTQSDAGSQRTVIRLGGNSGENERIVQREGNDVAFVVGRTMADTINPEVTAFQTPISDGGADASAAAPPPPPPPAPAAAPGGPGGPGGAGGLPPEVMEQIRRQLQQRGMQGAPSPH